MCRTIGLTKLWGRPSFIYEIPLADGSHAYMRVDPTNYLGEKRSVVIVDAAKFLAMWRACPHSLHADVAAGSPETWRSDRKYEQAAKGFAEGVENPVPLAEVNFDTFTHIEPIYERWLWLFKRKAGERQEDVPFVSFTNGVTRTIWLLANGAKEFPVECPSKEEAKFIYTHCGVGSPPATVNQLIPAFAFQP